MKKITKIKPVLNRIVYAMLAMTGLLFGSIAGSMAGVVGENGSLVIALGNTGISIPASSFPVYCAFFAIGALAVPGLFLFGFTYDHYFGKIGTSKDLKLFGMTAAVFCVLFVVSLVEGCRVHSALMDAGKSTSDQQAIWSEPD